MSTLLQPHGTQRPEPMVTQELPARVVVIGASTGGPGAVREILRSLPTDFPLPILLVLHISEQFDESMVEWLGKNAPFPVRHAVEGEALPPAGRPVVVMARANRHLKLSGGRLRLTDEPERYSCRPSVDVLFESVAQELGSRVIGCLLTGMGRDGAKGLQALRQAGATTLAQDEASCVVFGMPREAIRLGAAKYVVGLQDVPGWLLTLARRGLKGGPV
jgi:two-component system chemotaxis response regulator CheB